jgi:hypothetical protein
MHPFVRRERAALSSPMTAQYGAVMEPVCCAAIQTRWSILLTFENSGPCETKRAPTPGVRGSMSTSQLPSLGSSAMTLFIWIGWEGVELREINRS